MLQVWWEDDSLVSGLTRKLDTKIPRIKRDEGELEVVGNEMLLGELIEAVDGVTEGSCVTNVLPGQGGQTRFETSQYEAICITIVMSSLTAQGCDGCIDGLDEGAFSV